MKRKFKTTKERLILSLDTCSIKQAQELVSQFKDSIEYFAVNYQLFMAYGPQAFEMIKEEGGKVYFDGKFFETPNTVAKSSEVLVSQGITFFNVHALGGSKMMKLCAQAARQKALELNLPNPIILGVTILTSAGQKTLTEELGMKESLLNYSVKLAQLAQASGLDGVVASGLEASEIRKTCGEDFLILTPGIRPTWAAVNDQMRVLSPREAVEAGVDFLLIGRPIIQAKDPQCAIKLILDEIEDAVERNI